MIRTFRQRTMSATVTATPSAVIMTTSTLADDSTTTTSSLQQHKRMMLSPSSATNPNEVKIKGIIFDMDGTLTKPQTYMFIQMREALGILNKPIDILNYIDHLQGEEKKQASELVKKIEEDTMLEMEPQLGLYEFFTYMTDNQPDVKCTICTRNLIKPVQYLIQNHLPGLKLNEPILTRSFEPAKPSPKPLQHIAKCWGVDTKNLIMIGDSRDDMFAGLRAGCALILMKHKDNQHLVEEIPQIDYVVENYLQLMDVLQNGFDVKEKAELELTNKDIGYYC